MFGPVGSFFGSVAIFMRNVITQAGLLSITELVLFRCLLAFYWRVSAGLNDEFFATYFKIVNIVISILVTSITYMLELLENENYFDISGMPAVNQKDIL